jgi:hypothetical protein
VVSLKREGMTAAAFAVLAFGGLALVGLVVVIVWVS